MLDVHTQAIVQQIGDNSRGLQCTLMMQHCQATPIHGGHICPLLNQHLHHVKVLPLTGQMEGGITRDLCNKIQLGAEPHTR